MRWDAKYGFQILRFIAVVGAVYLAFRYLLPLVFPFIIAYLLACIARPVVGVLNNRLHVPKGLGAAATLGLFLVVIVWGIWMLGKTLLSQIADLAGRLPAWIDWCAGCVEQVCSHLERRIALEPGVLVREVQQVAAGAGEKLSQEGISFAMENSMTALRWVINAGVVAAFVFIASILFLTGEERRKAFYGKLPYHEELKCLRERLAQLAKTYVRCELLAIILTCAVCVIGLWIIGNPYALLIGIIIGILDALPLFGTGMVLIPWAVICFLGRDIWQGVALLLTYGAGYVLHQLLETRMLGESMGASPLMTLASFYVGMELFGLVGLILGPVSFILIREILGLWENTTEKSEMDKENQIEKS